MKRILLILLFFNFQFAILNSASAQELGLIDRPNDFIGCQTDSGWAESPMLRKHFEMEHIPKHGVYLEVTSLGYHEVYVNGKKVGDRVMQPAVSQLNKRALAVEYDIKEYIHEGENERAHRRGWQMGV